MLRVSQCLLTIFKVSAMAHSDIVAGTSIPLKQFLKIPPGKNLPTFSTKTTASEQVFTAPHDQLKVVPYFQGGAIAPSTYRDRRPCIVDFVHQRNSLRHHQCTTNLLLLDAVVQWQLYAYYVLRKLSSVTDLVGVSSLYRTRSQWL